jgi:hypothetical protein
LYILAEVDQGALQYLIEKRPLVKVSCNLDDKKRQRLSFVGCDLEITPLKDGISYKIRYSEGVNDLDYTLLSHITGDIYIEKSWIDLTKIECRHLADMLTEEAYLNRIYKIAKEIKYLAFEGMSLAIDATFTCKNFYEFLDIVKEISLKADAYASANALKK